MPAFDGGSSVSISEQANHDIDAEDFAAIKLTSRPQIGIKPKAPGRAKCVNQQDGSASSDGAVLVHGKASVTLDNGAIECIGGTAIVLESSANGTPSLSMSGTTIEDAQVGLARPMGWTPSPNPVGRFSPPGTDWRRRARHRGSARTRSQARARPESIYSRR